MKSNLYQIREEDLAEFELLYAADITDNAFFLFNAKLELDEVLRHKFVVYQLLREEIDNAGLEGEALKNRFQLLERSRKREKAYLKFSVLAFIVSVLVSVVFYSSRDVRYEHAQLYQQYKYAESGFPILMSDSTDNAFNTAMVQLAEKKFAAAAQLLKDCPPNDTTSYYLAYCDEVRGSFHLALGKYTKLKSSFSKLIKEKSTFRRALILLKLKHKLAQVELQKIASDQAHLYQPLASKILSSLSKSKVCTR